MPSGYAFLQKPFTVKGLLRAVLALSAPEVQDLKLPLHRVSYVAMQESAAVSASAEHSNRFWAQSSS